MKTINFNIIMIVAFITTGTTIAFHASALTNKRITGCWAGIRVQDLFGGIPSQPEPVHGSTNCFAAKSLIGPNAGTRYDYVSSLNTSALADFTFYGCTEAPIIFCCMQIREISFPMPQELATVPLVDFGDGPKRYKIIQVLCKPPY